MPTNRSVAALDITRVQVTYELHRTTLSTDGAASMSDVQLEDRDKSTESIDANGGCSKKPARPSVQASRRSSSRPRHTKPSNIPQFRRKRLPWLDGSESRKGSMPLAPGAYFDETPDAIDRRKAHHVPAHKYKHTAVDGARSVVASEAPSQETVTNDDNIELQRVSTKPALPLMAVARELYKTDSNPALSDAETERSVREVRRKVLSDPNQATSSRPLWNPSVAQPANLKVPQVAITSQQPRVSRFREDDPPSPFGPPVRRQTEAERYSSSRDGQLPGNRERRQPSLSLQPIRRVTMTPDDVEPGSHLNHQQSLSVQPLRRRGMSRSLQEDLSSDYVRKSGASKSPAERGLRDSIAGLESLMQEAVQVAKDAAENGRSEEVPAIMDEARIALQRATDVQQDTDIAMRAASSFPIAKSSSSSGSGCSSHTSEDSLTPSRTQINDERVHPAMRRRLFHVWKDGPTSDQGSALRASLPGGAQTVWDEDYPNHRVDLHARPDDTLSFDFAYQQGGKGASSAFVPDKGKAREGLQNQQRPPPSARGATTEEEIVRKALPTREDVQRHILENGEPPIPPRRSSLQQGAEDIVSVQIDVENDGPNASDAPVPEPVLTRRTVPNWGRDKFDEKDFQAKTIDLRGKNHFTLREGERFSLHHGHRRQPIARNWSTARKRFVATVTCCNTALIGVLIGIYAGEVPAIQYTLADLHHQVIQGNVYLYIGMAITTFFFWPLPLLHGRKPYTLVALGLALPLQIPQAIIVQEKRTSNINYKGYVTGLLLSRALLGLALGFAHINFAATLLDLFGASLQSEFPHGEVVIIDDIRRHGGGMGYWLGIWSFSFLGSLALGFLIGADVISGANQAWGFYICVILIALALFINVLTPETRRSPHRRTMQEVELPNESISRRVARGEIKMHVSGDGPKYWWQEVFAGVYLSFRMLMQSGFLLLALYMGWIYAQIVLIIVLLGNLLSAEYRWRPEYVGLGVLGIGIGALLAVPNSKANFFSKSRFQPPRTDSMTVHQPKFSWSSHLVRRAFFMTALPIAGLAYTLASKGSQVQYMVPIIFAALIGFISNLAIAECNGIIMETFDTSDLQPGTNSRHRLQSLPANAKRRRTSYTSYPRVSAGLFTAQSIGFLLAAAATGVGGSVTRSVGAQKATAITAGILLGLTLLLIAALYRFRLIQVIPNELFGQYFGSTDDNDRRKSVASVASDKSWRAVIIGNPSGKNRRMSWLELGSLSRWTEIRRLNRLLNRSTTQGLNTGWQ